MFTDFDRRLPGARAIHGQKADAERQDRAEALGQIFLAAVQPIHGQHEWHGPVSIFRQAQVADDFFSFEGNPHDLERWIPEARVCQESLDCFFVRALFAGRGGNRPASERIKPPRADVVGVRFHRVGFLQRLGFIHVAIGHSHKGRRPLVFIASMDGGEGFLDVAGIESDERIHSVLSAMDSLGLNLIERALGALLGEGDGAHRYRDSNND